jgi:phthalate 3,4-dioxygenase ferredoxin reductase component
MSTVVVVGSSIGGVRTAQALRTEGFTGRVVLVGEEAREPYDKPPLSKQFLAGDWDADRLVLLSRASAAAEGIDLRLGVAAAGLDTAGRQVLLSDGSTLQYDSVVVATGAAARPSPWRPDSGVHVLRTIDDGRALRADLGRDGPVVVIGGGFLGAEVAATAHALGHEVTVVDSASTPMSRVVGPEVGQAFTDLHDRRGVATRFGVGVADISGTAGRPQVQLTDGSLLHAVTVVVAIGALPNDGWLAHSGLWLRDGVLCDEYSRALGAPRVFAVGDVARWFHPDRGRSVRVEHWTNAVEQAAIAAHNIVHPDDLRSYCPVEYVWSDQYDWKIQLVGEPHRGTRHDIVGELAGENARAAVLYADGTGQLCGAVAVNWPKALVQCRRQLNSRGTFDDTRSAVARLVRPAEPALPVASAAGGS